jgi:histidine triad (HIT) family protein
MSESSEVQERLKLIKENCIFCKIVKKEIDAKIIYDDEVVLAILDINPVSKGHVLLMPKEHYFVFPQVPDEVLGHLNLIAKQISQNLIEIFNAKDVNVFIANGQAAGQQSTHFMLHLIPRYENDNINFEEILNNKEKSTLSEEEKEKLVSLFKKKLEELNNNLK